MRPASDSVPHTILRRLLAWLLPPDGRVRDGLLGDLDELYAERVARDRFAAELWYARQVVSAGIHFPVRRAGRWVARDHRGVTMDGLVRDLAQAIRAIRRRPGFTAVIVLTAALGIGASTAVFSVVRSVLLRPLPFPQDERLAVVRARAPIFNADEVLVSPPEYVAYHEHAQSWEALAAYQIGAATLTGEPGPPERIEVVRATWNLFATLGAEPLLGRAPADDDREVARDVAVLSHAFWTNRYGRDPHVLGRTVLLSGSPYTIVGVMAADFRFPTADVALWLPFAFTAQDLEYRGNHSYTVVGRLRPGVTLESAERELDDLVARFIADPAVDFHGWHPVHLRSLRDEIVGDVSRTLWVMFAAVAVVLMIACANVANLLLVRAEERAREMSVRTALGAARSRLVSQLLIEGLVLAGAGGITGVAVAYLGVEALRLIAPADLPRLDEIVVDGGVLAYTMLATMGAGVLFGLAPALYSGRADLQSVLRDEGRAATAGRGPLRLRNLLVVSQTTLAVVLLVAAGLLLQSFRRLMAVDPGYRTESVLTARVTTSYSEERDLVAFYETLSSRVASLPGVVASGAAFRAPLGGALTPSDIAVEGWLNPGDAPRPLADVQAVAPGYFEAMGIPVLDGRRFDERDGLDAPPVALVSEALARAYWSGRPVIGGRIRLDNDDEPFAQVVGIVPDIRQVRLDRAAARGTLYLPYAQTPLTWGRVHTMTLTVRTSVDPTSLVTAIRREIHALDPSAPLYEIRTMKQAVADTTATSRFSMLLQALFALVALALATVGLYGVLAFTVARRTAEIGIRMALGAQASDVQRMVVRQGMRMVAVALVLGLMAALAIARLLGSLLFGVSPLDPVTYVTVVGVLVLAALMACWIPSRRASRVDPAGALRAA
jgi:putative ABC transport system permease protein